MKIFMVTAKNGKTVYKGLLYSQSLEKLKMELEASYAKKYEEPWNITVTESTKKEIEIYGKKDAPNFY